MCTAHLGYENVVAGTTSKENYTRENLVDHLERYAYLGFSAVISIADLVEREIMPGDHLNVFQAPRDPQDAEDRSLPLGRRAVADAGRGRSQRGALSHGGAGDVVAGGGGGRPSVQK